MLRSGLFCACVATWLLAAGSVARADETIHVEGQAPAEGDRDRDQALTSAPFVTVIHPDEHPATTSVAEALATSAGAQMRSTGGFGAYASVSVRGAATGHTAVLVDGVPLSRLAGVTTDLGRYHLDAFGKVELFRGAVPLELGGAGVGGAVNLVTRLGRGEGGERLDVLAGVGSYGARFARGRYGDEHGDWLSSVTLGYQGATGDFSVFTDRGTPLNAADDAFVDRANNRFDQIDGAARLGTRDGATVSGVRMAWRDQGLPGTIIDPTTTAGLGTLNTVGDVRLQRGAFRVLAYGLAERQALSDPMGELGLGAQDRSYLTLSGGAATTWHASIAAHRLTAGLELRGDRFRDAAPARASMVGTRGTGAASLAADLALGDRITLTPAVRFELVRTAPTALGEGPDAFMPVDPRWDALPSPRFTALARLGDDLALKSSVGSYVRLPTLLELFGDRGQILGSPDLLVERGLASDAGFVYAPTSVGPFDRVLVEAAAFATRSRDTIALISGQGFVARAMNIGDTQTYGAELVVSGRLARTVSLTTSYTRLVSEQLAIDPNRFGRALPRTPAHLLYARVDLARRIAARRVTAYVDLAAQSTSYLDMQNLARVPRRGLVGAGVRSEIAGGFALSVTVANALDTRVVELPADRPGDTARPIALSDVAGFPLPGRAFTASVDFTY